MTARARVSGEIESKVFFTPTPKNPVLVCGLPGSGYVGKLGADYLVSTFGAKKVVEYYSSSFPPHVNVTEDGKVRPVRAELYHGETGQGNDLLIFTADAQPTTSRGEYELSDVVLKLARRYGVKTVYSLAAYITGFLGVGVKKTFDSISPDTLALAVIPPPSCEASQQGRQTSPSPAP